MKAAIILFFVVMLGLVCKNQSLPTGLPVPGLESISDISLGTLPIVSSLPGLPASYYTVTVANLLGQIIVGPYIISMLNGDFSVVFSLLANIATNNIVSVIYNVLLTLAGLFIVGPIFQVLFDWYEAHVY